MAVMRSETVRASQVQKFLFGLVGCPPGAGRADRRGVAKIRSMPWRLIASKSSWFLLTGPPFPIMAADHPSKVRKCRYALDVKSGDTPRNREEDRQPPRDRIDVLQALKP